MTNWSRPDSAARYTWPRWSCSAIDGARGTVCGLDATWKELPVPGAETWWLRCHRHRSDHAVPIAADEPYCVTRLELRVAMPGLGTDRRAAVDQAVRLITSAVSEVGGVIVGLKVPGRQASEATSPAALGRLTLAGPPEGHQAADRPFWGVLDGRDWPFWRKRRTG